MSLKISEDFSLPVDVAGEAIGILATRGAGKSFASAVLVEELYDAGIQGDAHSLLHLRSPPP